MQLPYCWARELLLSTSYKGTTRKLKKAMHRKTRQGHSLSSLDGVAEFDLEAPADDLSSTALFILQGQNVSARLTKSALQLTHQGSCCPWRHEDLAVPFSEIFMAAKREGRGKHKAAWCSCSGPFCRRTKPAHCVIVHTFRRDKRWPCNWRPLRLTLYAESAELVSQWASDISDAVRVSSSRPQSLLVFVNPFGGTRRAAAIWQTVLPVFQLVGAKCEVVETKWAAHARELVEKLSLEELQRHDGIIAVGGDGLFQELLNGLLAVRSNQQDARSVAAKRLRLGHVPAGSTDAVAYSINGTRSAFTAAAHIALGDRMGLDVMRVDSSQAEPVFSVCYAAYGYMADLVQSSEHLRWLGSLRLGLAGALNLLRGKSYQAQVHYLPSRSSTGGKLECQSSCAICAAAVEHEHPNLPDFSRPSLSASQHSHASQWQHQNGQYKSIMVIVSPCRSDMSPAGLSRYSHLSDGRITLVLVKRCSVLQYLRFMATIPYTGVQAGPFADLIHAKAVEIIPEGEESLWNIDGELHTGSIKAQERKRHSTAIPAQALLPAAVPLAARVQERKRRSPAIPAQALLPAAVPLQLPRFQPLDEARCNPS
ncbi:hypothetical protein WJX84_009195 [Apatococcus fuscideae]|uniref:DAGKc domain-containing protein n=1 Tax=Apatococcus fuscideae TaxID=2026836 RepID=A0AAW1TAG6_9CHLO